MAYTNKIIIEIDGIRFAGLGTTTVYLEWTQE